MAAIDFGVSHRYPSRILQNISRGMIVSSKRILVVDNEPSIQEVAQICLETVAGWQVTIAGSGLEGLATAEREQPDAILLDVMMPDMDGLDTFSKLQANPADCQSPNYRSSKLYRTGDSLDDCQTV
jgi:CheY-like chemotaxis protein